MIEVVEKTDTKKAENQYHEVKVRWRKRIQETTLSADPRETLMRLSGVMIELTNTTMDLYQIAALLKFGDTWGLKEETLKRYRPKVELDPVHNDGFRLSFGMPILVLPEENLGERYQFSNEIQAAYQETIFAQETGRGYRIYALSRDLEDGDFWIQCAESDIRLGVRKTGSTWTLWLILPNEINGGVVQDFTRWVRLLKEARNRSQHPEPERTKLSSSAYYLD